MPLIYSSDSSSASCEGIDLNSGRLTIVLTKQNTEKLCGAPPTSLEDRRNALKLIRLRFDFVHAHRFCSCTLLFHIKAAKEP